MRLRLQKWSVAVLMLFTSGAPLAAQQTGTITGVVRETGTARAVAGASVAALGAGDATAATAVSDAQGRYTLRNLRPGSYTVVASTAGFDSRRRPGVTVTAGQTATVDVEVSPSAMLLDPLVVSASRRPERALEAPARVEVVRAQEIQERPAPSAVEHLRSVPGIDIATSGVQSANVVARGFNNVFSGSLYALTDHRIAGVPSLRVNLLHFVPATDEDIERMEVVLGPGSALYGPNTANGVLHILTRSPLTDQGTSVSVAGGERSLFHGTFRTSQLVSENFGVKVSGQFLQADEWQYRDPVEDAERAKFQQNTAFWRSDLMRAAGIGEAEANARIGRIAARDYDVQRWSADARADWRFAPDAEAVFSAGTTTSNGIELTGLGAGQAVDWRYSYYQARARWGRAFGQVYLNASDAGETFLLRNGAPIVDKSKLLVSQLQHGLSLGTRQSFTYGLDFLYTMPETEGTINGIYEDDDETQEIGAYLQSETSLGSKLDLVLAGRLDDHSALPDPVFSPRAALVFRPRPDHALRLTFNRAFSTPSSLNQFLDLGTPIPDVGAARLGYSLRVQGTGREGFRFRQDNGGYLIRSPFTPAALGGPRQLLPAQQARLFWPAAVQVVAAQAAAAGQPLPAQLVTFLSGLNATPVGLGFFHPTTRQQGSLADLSLPDVEPIRESTSNTFEVGYKGLLGGKLLLAADVWYSKRENLVTPLTVATPFIRFDAATAQAFLIPALTQFFRAAGMPQAQAEATARAQAPLLAGGIAQVPVGVVSSADVNANGAQFLLTYTNVDDDLNLYGTDLSASALLSRDWSLDATASLVNKDVFTTRRGQRVTLNAPKSKGSLALNYRNAQRGLNGQGRVRYNAAYPVDSGVFRGTQCLQDVGAGVEPCVDSYTLVDLTLGYRLPQVAGASVQLSVQNLLDEEYRSFPGVPQIGRMALLRLRYEF